MQKAIKYAFLEDLDNLKESLKEFNDHITHGYFHDNIARIAIIKRNREMFNITLHHIKIMMEECAPDPESFKFIMPIY